VRILRLSSPLAVHDNGALRLVGLLERAHRVAGNWRESTQNAPLSLSEQRFAQLAECGDTGEFTVPEPFSFVDQQGKTVQSDPPPLLRSTSVRRQRFRLSSPSILSSKGSPFSSSTSLHTSSSLLRQIQRKKIHRASVPQPSPFSLAPVQQDGLRAFDALLNFLPSGVPDKALLKHAILVTTLSAHYLAVPGTTTRDEGGLNRWNHDPTSKSTTRISVPGSSSNSFSSSLPSSTTSSMTHSTSIATTPTTSPSPSPPLIPSSFSRGSGKSTIHLNIDMPKIKGTIKAAFAKGLSSFLHPPSPSANSAFASSGTVGGVPYTDGRVIDPRANGGGDGCESPTRPKNAHIVHILPLDWVDWEEQLREKDLRDPQQSKGGSSSGKYQGDGVNVHHDSHTSGNLNRHHDVTGNVASGSKPRTPGTSRVSAKPKLGQGIEQFLLSFAFPLGSLGLGPGSGGSRPAVPASLKSAHGHGDAKSALTGLAAAAAHAQTRPVPYLLAPGVFERALDGAREEYPRKKDSSKTDFDRPEDDDSLRARRALVIGEIILLGALDFDLEEAYGQKDAYTKENDAYTHYLVEDRGNARAVGGGRAWVGVGDVICSKGEERKETEREEKVVDKEERDRRIRETERRLEASIPHRTSTNRATNISPNTRKATQTQPRFQLPTPPDSSSSLESIEEGHLGNKYPTPAPPTRVYASTKEPERDRHKDSARTSRKESIRASTSQREDKLGPGPNPAPASTCTQPLPSSGAQGSVVRSTSRSGSNPPVLASTGPTPPRPGRNPMRSESGEPAKPPTAYSYGSSAQAKMTSGSTSPSVVKTSNPSPSAARQRTANASNKASARVVPSTPPVRTPSTTRTQHEHKAAKDTPTAENSAARHVHGEQQKLPTRPRATPISDSMTTAEASHHNRNNKSVRDRGDIQQETMSNKLRNVRDHGLRHSMSKLGLWKVKAT